MRYVLNVSGHLVKCYDHVGKWLWSPFEIFVINLWNISGQHVECKWSNCGMLVVYLWNVSGQLVECKWSSCEMLVVNLWNVSGQLVNVVGNFSMALLFTDLCIISVQGNIALTENMKNTPDSWSVFANTKKEIYTYLRNQNSCNVKSKKHNQ